MCLGRFFTSRKTRRMHGETASEMASLPWSQNKRKENAARTKYARTAMFLKLFVHKNTTTCMSRHNSRSTWLLDLSPKQSHN